MNYFYKLNEDKTISPCTGDEWKSQIKKMDKTNTKHVALDFIDGKKVSTVWLGIDHGYPEWLVHGENYKPLVFETMVFKGEKSLNYCERYSTWKEALQGHKRAIQWVMDGCKDDE